MKNLIKTLFAITLCLPLTLSAQEWSGAANTTSTISRTGKVNINNTTTVRRLHIDVNTVTNTPDISLSAQAMIETESNMFLNIDSDNNTNNASFTIGKNSPTTTGDTPLFRVNEAGSAYLYSGHYRTYGDGGLYNQTDKTYFYSDNTNYFRLRSDAGLAIANRDNIRMGSICHNNNNTFGLLDGNNKWVFKSVLDDYISLHVDDSEKMRIDKDGNVGIGTDTPDNKLDVNGIIRAKEIKVEEGWSDYVFYDDYQLPTLEDEEKHIKANGHLLGFESEKAMAGEIQLGDVSKRQQAKIEEMMLHLIELSKQNDRLQAEVTTLKAQINKK